MVATMADESDPALELWREGTEVLLQGRVEDAIALFTRSLEARPTAEAYTCRGWAYSFAGKLEEAILECRKAIATDPRFGNPYNDIGCYLMEQGRWDEAIPWFESAKKASRYEPRHFPYLNLGRLHAARGEVAEAIAQLEGALTENPGDPVALQMLEQLRHQIN